MLKSYIPGVNSSVFPMQHHNNIFPEILVNGLHEWMEKHPNVIQFPNISYSLFVKINGTLVKKQKHIIQVSVQELHNDIILPIYQGFFCARTGNGKLFIVDASIMKYILKYIKPMRKRNSITCECNTCINAILLPSYINKWILSQLEKLDKLYINSVSTRLLQRSKIYLIQYNNQIFRNNSHINLRSCNSSSSYHCPSPIKVYNIPKWDFILNCCSYFPRINAP